MNRVAKLPTQLSEATENKKNTSSFQDAYCLGTAGFCGWLVWFGLFSLVSCFFGLVWFLGRSWQSADLWCPFIHANIEEAVCVTNRWS